MYSRNAVTILTLLSVALFADAGRVPQLFGLDPLKAPENVAVFEGTTVTFRCWVDSTVTENPRVQWTEFAYSSNGQLISDGDYLLPAHPQYPRYSLVRDDPLQYDLVVPSVTLADAGTYSCFDANAPITSKQRGAAQLVVIAGVQNCTGTVPPDGTVLEDAYHTFECILDYRGNIIPHGSWTGPGPFEQATSSTDSRVWSGMSFVAHRTMSGEYWTSKFNFTDYFLPVPADTAENIPDLQDRMNSLTIRVYWAPKNMYASPQKDFYVPGDEIQCYADANPLPMYEWHNLRTNERYPGAVLVIPENWVGFDQTMRCQAINTISEQNFSGDLYIDVRVPAPTTTPTTTPSTTTTPPPAVSNCLDLTGRWESVGPTRAYMCIEVLGTNGNLHGVLRNDTDTFWVDLVGVTDLNNYDHASFTGIWPLNRAVSTFIGECSRCHGVEHLLINAVSRTKGGPPCATAGEINYSLQYDFLRNPDIHCPPITIPPE